MTGKKNSPEHHRNAGRPLTDDSLFNGGLICRQYGDGYRFSVDSILAAHFCRLSGSERVLDLGCGSGIIGLILAGLHPNLTLVGLELQQDLADLCAMNISANHFQSRFSVICGDARKIGSYVSAESFDLVVCNPPYRKIGSGRVSRTDEAAIARHELKANLDDMLAAAAFAVKNRGQVVVVYPAVRLASLVAGMHQHALVPGRLQPVYSYPEAEQATLVVVEAVKNGGEGCDLLPPLYIYAGKNMGYSPEMKNIYTAIPSGHAPKGQGAA
ncbi:MAG TPA: methyltransferase domain-containing protein [Desulfobulbus sp.]|nr:methyltransferase domain-containing protein [Desulfobulbus sp.]